MGEALRFRTDAQEAILTTADYGYSTTSYGAQGGNEDGGFMAGSQDSPSAKRVSSHGCEAF